MIEELLGDILQQSKIRSNESLSEQQFIETILDNIYQFLYKSGQPVHTIAIGILRGNTFDMYYRGRILDRFAERFGAMSYETTLAGRACEQFKQKKTPYLHLYSKKKIKEEFTAASEELKKEGLKEEAESMKKRANATTDQGVSDFLLMPIYFGEKIIGIFTVSSLNESDETHIFGQPIKKLFVPLVQMLSLILYMERISFEKSEEMSRLLISSIDGKDEYQATHSLNVRTMIDMFIDELSRDKELRERVEGIGFKLTVDRIERLRLAALLHDIGKVFIPSGILRKSSLNSEEMLVRKMHSYCTYNMLIKSDTLKDIADIASMHHARYYIPVDTGDLDEYTKVETQCVGYPFDLFGQDHFSPESQIIALADTFNAIIRARPDRDKGLSVEKAIEIIEHDDHKFHGGLKEIFLTIVKRVKNNLIETKYLPEKMEEYRDCLWLDKPERSKNKKSTEWTGLYKFLRKIKYNYVGIIAVMDFKDAACLMNEEIDIEKKPLQITQMKENHFILSVRDIPKEEGFIWLDRIFNHLKKDYSCKGKISFAFVGKRGYKADLDKIYSFLKKGLQKIKNEPVHYYLNPEMFMIE